MKGLDLGCINKIQINVAKAQAVCVCILTVWYVCETVRVRVWSGGGESV